jgi:acetyl esterase/lipase
MGNKYRIHIHFSVRFPSPECKPEHGLSSGGIARPGQDNPRWNGATGYRRANRIARLLWRRYLLKVKKMSPKTPLLTLAVTVASAALAQQTPITWIHSSPPAHMLPVPGRNPSVPLWSNGAPGSEGKTADEKYRIVGDLLVVSGVNRPSITLYLPAKEKATGAAIIVAPGGSFREIWITHEGYRVADWLAQHGIAAFVLKYRLQDDEGSSYTTEGHSLPDIQRAIRLVRSHSAEWGVDPNRVGVMGFSAGGALAGLAGSRFLDPVKNPVDDIDKLNARPAFMALIYGTPFAPPMPYPVKIQKDMPPVFLAAGGDDEVSASYPEVYRTLKDAGVPAELHLYSGVGHGFGMQRSIPLAAAGWTEQLWDWMFDRGLLSKK